MTSGDHAAAVEPREDQPLLGQPGEVVQNIYRNFLSGEFMPDLISGAGTPTDHQIRNGFGRSGGGLGGEYSLNTGTL